jgi:hypothetical protein
MSIRRFASLGALGLFFRNVSIPAGQRIDENLESLRFGCVDVGRNAENAPGSGQEYLFAAD